jgi:hypothetical protein
MSDDELPDWYKQRQNKAMELAEKVRRRLTELEINPTQAALSVGLKSGFITDILNGRKSSVQGRNFEKLASALHWTPEDLLGFGSTKSNKTAIHLEEETLIPVLGYVDPGVWVDTRTETQGPIDFTDYFPVLGKTEPDRQFDMIVRGSSLNKIAIPGQSLRCVYTGQVEMNFVGSIYIIEQQQGFLKERSAMRIERETRSKLTFKYVSSDPKWGGALEVDIGEDGLPVSTDVKFVGHVRFVYRSL